MAREIFENSKSFDEKINDFCAEFGVSRDDISVDETLGPNEFIVNRGYDEITVVILAEDEIHDYALYLATETLFDSFGFVEKDPTALDNAVDNDQMSEIIDSYYYKEGARLAEIPNHSYPNELARVCIDNDAIEDADLDRYFNSDGSWLDPQAKQDLCNAYASKMTEENISHPVSWMQVHWDPNSKFWKDLGKKSAVDIKDILEIRELIDIDTAAPIALRWNLNNGKYATEMDFIAKYAGEMKRSGDYYAFCDDWDGIRSSDFSDIDNI